MAFNGIISALRINPFRLYCKIAGWGFGFTSVSNLIGSNCVSNPPISMKDYPQTFATGLLVKSLSHGILWPAIPFKIYQNPREYFVLGGGCEKVVKEIGNDVSELEKEVPEITNGKWVIKTVFNSETKSD